MKKFVCKVCGYVYEGENPPEFCPQCKAPASSFAEAVENASYATEHVVGIAKGVDPEIAEAFRRYAFEEAEHAAKFAELLGEVVTDSTKKNLELRVEAEMGACAGKFEIAKKAKAQNLDAIHDTVHEMAKDEARHGQGFAGLLKRYF